jgi:competence protein ComEC
MTVPAFIGGLSKDIARHLEITCLDVGHGQAMVVSLPNGRNFLLDAGSLTRKNCGSRIVVPFLKDKGIGHLDGVFVSHDDIDHLNGLPELLASVSAKGVYVNDGFMANAQTRSSGGYFRQWLEKNASQLEPLEHGLKRTGSARITAIWPDKETCLDESISDNDKSQVLLIEYAGRKVLICSDIETLAQEKILTANPNLKVDVVIMPHHGSKSNLIENFFQKLGAEVLIASCSEGRYENAHKEKTTDNYFTAVDGAITIRIERDGRLSVDGFRGKNAMRRH